MFKDRIIFNYMVKYKLDTSFNALSDPTRRDILQRLTHKAFTVSEIAEAYNMSLPAVSKHLKVLETSGLITKQRRGRQQVIKMAPSVLRNITEHMLYYEALLNNRLDSLERYLHNRASPQATPAPSDVTKPAEQKLVISHIFDIPREEVWKAYTDPKQIAQWWAPKGTVLLACENDVRIGGRWRFVLEGSDNQHYVFSGIFKEVDEPTHLLYTDGFGEANEPRPEALVTVEFEDLPGGKTKLTKTSVASPAVHQLQAAMIKSIEGTI